MRTDSLARRVHRLASMSGALVAAGCATAPQPMEPDALLGCWYFDPDAAPRELRLPWGVRLAGEPAEGWPALQTLGDVRLAQTLTPASPQDYPIGYWRLTAEGDSLEMGYPAGGGLLVHVAVPREGEETPVLDGTVQSVGDVIDSRGQASGREPLSVRLTWARCP